MALPPRLLWPTAVAAIFLTGCDPSDESLKKQPTASAPATTPSTAPPQPDTGSRPDWSTHPVALGVTVQCPTTWSVQRVNGTGLLLMAPNEEADWQANVFLEVTDDRAPQRGLRGALEELARNLATRKPGFALKETRLLSHPAVGEIGRIEYTCRNQDTPLTEWEVIIPLAGTKRVLVLASSATANYPAHGPLFTRIVESVRDNGE